MNGSRSQKQDRSAGNGGVHSYRPQPHSLVHFFFSTNQKSQLLKLPLVCFVVLKLHFSILKNVTVLKNNFPFIILHIWLKTKPSFIHATWKILFCYKTAICISNWLQISKVGDNVHLVNFFWTGYVRWYLGSLYISKRLCSIFCQKKIMFHFLKCSL